MKLKVNDLNYPDKTASPVSASLPNGESELMRLQTFLAHAGVASRRSCELIITEGRVSVNGVVVTAMGTKVSAHDTVCVDGKPVTPEEVMRYVVLNKPSGYVCSLADEKNRPVAADLLKSHFAERLYNVGRLDMFSSGLILFTNDGSFAARLSHPSAEIEKEYLIETSLAIPAGLAERFAKGVRIDTVFYKAQYVERLSSRRLRVVLLEGKNREIRRVMESFDVHVKNLCRIRIGSLSLSSLNGSLWRELTKDECQSLLSLCRNTASRGI